MKKHIPNILTLANLFVGCVGIVYTFNNNLAYAAYAIWIAAVFDFFDGFVLPWGPRTNLAWNKFSLVAQGHLENLTFEPLVLE